MKFRTLKNYRAVLSGREKESSLKKYIPLNLKYSRGCEDVLGHTAKCSFFSRIYKRAFNWSLHWFIIPQ